MLHPMAAQTTSEMVVRLVAATLMGSMLGIDRDLHRKPAGLRVLAMVAMTSAGAMIFSLATLPESGGADGVLRTVQGILAGIGFLGAGVILRNRGGEEVHGITTAASVWTSAVLGLAVGMGEWPLGGVMFALALLVLVIGRRIERAILERAPPPPPPLNMPGDAD